MSLLVAKEIFKILPKHTHRVNQINKLIMTTKPFFSIINIINMGKEKNLS